MADAASHQITGIVLAAGSGKRFGGDKCLAKLPSGMAMGAVAATNLAQVVDRLICVVRASDALLQNELRAIDPSLCSNSLPSTSPGFRHPSLTHPPLEIVIGEGASAGMSASLRAGIQASPEASGWIIALADMPLIKPATYRAITKEAIKHLNVTLANQQPILVPNYQSQDGHPVYFPARFRDDLLALRGDRGAKKLLHHYPESVQRIAVNDAGILQDFDTRSDFDHYKF